MVGQRRRRWSTIEPALNGGGDIRIDLCYIVNADVEPMMA